MTEQAQFPMSDEEFERQYQVASKRGEERLATEPYAVRAWYDGATKRVGLDLSNDTTFLFPAHLGQGLSGATDEELAEVEVAPGGYGLHWERLDADLLVSALLMGIFGSQAWMRQIRAAIGRKAGAARSAPKAAAARANGKKGGRPRKTAAS